VAPVGVNGELFFVGRSPAQDLWWWRQSGSQWTWTGNNGVSSGSLAAIAEVGPIGEAESGRSRRGNGAECVMIARL